MASSSSFRIVALAREPFESLFTQDERTLAAQGMRRVTADAKPGFPCRVSLADAEPGEELMLLPFTHQPVETPYRASGPIFVRERAVRSVPAVGEVPESIRRRLLSIRAYGGDHMMLAADVCPGAEFESVVERLFVDPRVAYLHVHNAKPGCFACRVDRA